VAARDRTEDLGAAAEHRRKLQLAAGHSLQLGTDLNRDAVAAVLIELGARPVRQIALDATWSALRFPR
jgi:hypothetical protein